MLQDAQEYTQMVFLGSEGVMTYPINRVAFLLNICAHIHITRITSFSVPIQTPPPVSFVGMVRNAIGYPEPDIIANRIVQHPVSNVPEFVAVLHQRLQAHELLQHPAYYTKGPVETDEEILNHILSRPICTLNLPVAFANHPDLAEWKMTGFMSNAVERVNPTFTLLTDIFGGISESTIDELL
jgi:hypothetical protein